MKTSFFLNAIRIVVIFIFTIGTFLGLTTFSTSASSLDPFISANTIGNVIYAYNWPLDIPVDLTISDQSGEIYWQTVASELVPWRLPGQDGTVAIFQLTNGFDLLTGHVIEVSGAGIAKTYTVTNFAVTVIDPATDTIGGIGTSGSPVTICPQNPPGNCRFTTVDSSGTWSAPHEDPSSFTLQAGAYGYSIEVDVNGDETYANWNVPNPRIQVRAKDNQVEGYEWGLGETVTLKIDNLATPADPDYTTTQPVVTNPWSPSQTYVNFWLGTDYDIQTGDIVSLSNGDKSITKTTIVTSLAFTSFDVEANTVSGIAAPNSRVDVWACDLANCSNSYRHVNAGNDGNWVADFGTKGKEGDEQTTIDLVPGTWVDSQQVDVDSDSTMYGRNVPNPWINAYLSENRVESAGWMVGENLEMKILDSGTTYTAVTTPCSWDPFCGSARFELGPGFTLNPGQTITVSNGNLTKTMKVMDLYVDSYDPAAKTVDGHSDPLVKVTVDIWGPDADQKEVKADETGSWQVTFDSPPDSFAPFTDGSATGWDNDGNTTIVRINMGNINVWPGGDIVRDGCTLSRIYTLTIDDNSNGPGVNFTKTGQCVLTADGTNTTVAYQLEGFTLDAGDLITVASGHDIRTLVVTPRGRVAFDFENDAISGINQPNNYVGVWINEVQSWRTVQVGPDGTWSIDYSVPGTNGETEDIVRGMSGSVLEYNAVGDNTGYGLSMPFLDVHHQYDLVYAVGWNRGDLLMLSIDDLSGKHLADSTAIVGDAPWGDPNATAGDFPLAGFDLQPGQVLTVTGPVGKIIYTIPDPKITKFDVIADTVSGTGTAGKRMQVSPNYPGLWLSRNVPVDGIGNWTVSFAPSSNPSDSPGSFDLQPGSQVSFSEINEYGDQTWGDDWTVPYPSSGKATGKGSFTSPAGALSSNPGQTGKAVFTFEAKYARNGFDLVGSLRLNFEGFIFQSTGLGWLVVENNRMQLTGTGTVNAIGGYAFMLNAQKDGEGNNTIAIRIWNIETGEVAYDSALGAPDYVLPATVLKDGSFVFTPPQPPAPGSTTITIWNGLAPEQLPAVQRVLAKYRQMHPNVNFVLQPMGDLDAAIANGTAPDLIWWGNDVIGSFANNAQIIDLGQLGITDKWLNNTYSATSLNGVQYNGKTWALPESQEGIALVYNKALVPADYLPASPLNFADLLAKADAYLKNTGKTLICNQGFPGGDAYHIAPIFFGFGVLAYVDEAGNAYLNTPQAMDAGNWLAAMQPLSPVNHNDCFSEFVKGNVGMWWTGPWALAGLDSAGVDYGIIAMGRPFVGIKALAVTTIAKNRGSEYLAADIAKFLTNTSNSISMTLANKTIPANGAALVDIKVQAIPSIAGFSAAISLGIPMDPTPFSACQWGPVAKAEATIWAGGDVQDALSTAQAEILSCASGISIP